MIKPRAVRQLPECPTCRFYCGNPYLFCAVMPDGVDNDFCPYFAPDPDVEAELWEPEGARYIDEDLVIERVTYNGEEIIQPQQRWTREEQLELVDMHPMFTGCCPQCGHFFDSNYTARVHYDCPECGWMDDSV